MLVRLRKSFRTRVHSLNPKTFAFFFVDWLMSMILLDALRGRQTDMFFCSLICSLFFPPFRGSAGGRKGRKRFWKPGVIAWLKAEGESLVRMSS
jgi:hypothetical protein